MKLVSQSFERFDRLNMNRIEHMDLSECHNRTRTAGSDRCPWNSHLNAWPGFGGPELCKCPRLAQQETADFFRAGRPRRHGRPHGAVDGAEKMAKKLKLPSRLRPDRLTRTLAISLTRNGM